MKRGDKRSISGKVSKIPYKHWGFRDLAKELHHFAAPACEQRALD